MDLLDQWLNSLRSKNYTSYSDSNGSEMFKYILSILEQYNTNFSLIKEKLKTVTELLSENKLIKYAMKKIERLVQIVESMKLRQEILYEKVRNNKLEEK